MLFKEFIAKMSNGDRNTRGVVTTVSSVGIDQLERVAV